MVEGETVKAPWHFWVIGVIALLWYASGAYTIQMAELGQLPGLQPDEAAYYAAKPMWQSIVTGIGTYGSVLASILLLMRRRSATLVFAVALALILLIDVYELSNGTSRVYANNAAAIVTGIIAVIAAFMVWYSRAMQRRGVLR
jgi:hypothetical protein